MMSDLILIELTDADAKRFRDFRRFQDDFERIIEAGAFGGLSNGKIILNMHNGQIANIVVERKTFDRNSLPNQIL